MRILAADWVLPIDAPPIERGAVAFEDGRIIAVGAVAALGSADEVYEGAVIVPGFVNAHSHLEYAVYAGFGDGLEFGPWLALHVARKGRIELDEMRAIARLGAVECLRSGTSTVGDASFVGAAAEACAELNLRAIVYLEGFGRRSNLGDRFRERRARIEHLIDGGVRLGVSPHAPYTTTLDAYAAATELGLPLATHLAESVAEREWLLSGTGPWEPLREILVPPIGTTGVRLLAEHGLLGPHVVAAHCVHVDEEEIRLLAENDVAIAHCPRSNAILGCGIAPLRRLIDAGLRVGLGTDSPASTPSFDMFEEMRMAVYAARARERRADALSATQALELATLGAARALRLETEVGSLTPGKSADLTVVSLQGSPFSPIEDPAAAVVFGGSPDRILCTVTQGETRYEKGVTDWHELTAAASSARARMLAQAPQPVRELA